MLEIKVGERPFEIPEPRVDFVQVVVDVLTALKGEIDELIRRRFPGVYYGPGGEPSLMVVPSMPGQHTLVSCFVDMMIECRSTDRLAMKHGGAYYQCWTGSFGFERRELNLLNERDRAKLICLRAGNAVKRMKETELGTCDQVDIGAEDMLLLVEAQPGDYLGSFPYAEVTKEEFIAKLHTALDHMKLTPPLLPDDEAQPIIVGE